MPERDPGRSWSRRGYTWGHCAFHCGLNDPFQVTGEEDICPSWDKAPQVTLAAGEAA